MWPSYILMYLKRNKRLFSVFFLCYFYFGLDYDVKTLFFQFYNKNKISEMEKNKKFFFLFLGSFLIFSWRFFFVHFLFVCYLRLYTHDFQLVYFIVTIKREKNIKKNIKKIWKIQTLLPKKVFRFMRCYAMWLAN